MVDCAELTKRATVYGLGGIVGERQESKILQKGFVIYEFGGDVHKYIGDAIFATFETPQDAVEAAVAIQREIATLKTEFKVRIGIHRGRSIQGNVGSEFRRDNTLIGDAVNTAQRLESNCTPGHILLSKDVYDEVRSRLGLEGTPKKITVKGKEEPIEVFEVDP